jgi:hypothetical protein
METYRVIGTHPVSGTDPGGTVELDPERVNIPALIESGAVEVLKAKPAKATAKAPGGDE